MKTPLRTLYLVSSLFLLNSQTTSADILSDADAVFGWAEQSFPNVLGSAQNTKSIGDWLYREYPSTGVLVGVFKPDNGVYYISNSGLARGDKPTFYDSLPNLMKLASAKQPSKPDNFQSLVGSWVLEKSLSSGVDSSGKPFELNLDSVVENTTWVFYSDGRFKATANELPDQNGRWTLSVVRVDGQDIEEGKLTIISSAFESIGLGQLEYKIATTSKVNGLKLFAETDASSWSSNPKHTIYYTFHKQ